MNRFSRSQAAILVLISLLLLSFYGWRHYTRFRQSPQPKQLAPMGVVVQVSGKVCAPGIYFFDQSVTVSEAVARAGGLNSFLKPESGWTGLRVGNGRRLHIVADAGGIGRVRLGWMTVSRLLVLGLSLDVNQASVEELILVPGISRRLAKRIIARRQRLGGFSRMEDLVDVKGIGPGSLRRLRQYLTVGSKIEGTGLTSQGATSLGY
jgi:competence ComEA-like helix-hairpin-helix protein